MNRKYDFESIIDRRGKDALAVDAVGTSGGNAPSVPKDGFDVIPMWIADMNFAVAPSIQKAMTDRIAHPTFGYFSPRDEYYDAIISWQTERNGAAGLKRENIGYENGVLGGVASALNTICPKGGNVLLHSPCYIGFTSTLSKNGFHIVHSPLTKDSDGIFRMDYEDMERKIVSGKIHAAIICSPHNPCGRVWERDELEKAYELFEKYEVKVVSDEIWSDIIMPGNRHIPSQSVSHYAHDNTVALYAPTKTFNLAGLIGSYHVIYGKSLRDRVEHESELCHYNDMNILSMYALLGAYSPEGKEWLAELIGVIEENIEYAVCFIEKNFKGVSVTRPQGTYMLFCDWTGYCTGTGKTIDEVIRKCWDVGVGLQDGRPFHGECHTRINLALPKSRVIEAFDRIQKYVLTEADHEDIC